MTDTPAPFVSRGGLKLRHALDEFGVNPTGWVCADLGSSTGGFTHCLLTRGAARVYAVDTGYGALAWTLRKDARVVVMERTNALHVSLPEPVDLVTADMSWTRQVHILPAAARLLRPGGLVITLVKPHYEAPAKLIRKGVLPPEHMDQVIADVEAVILRHARIMGRTPSPIVGHGGNSEWLYLLSLTPNSPDNARTAT